MQLKRTDILLAGFYDFDVTGGAVGSYDLQVVIPRFTVVTEFAVVVKDAVTSVGGMATISFDTIQIDVAPPIATVGALLVATLEGSFTLGAVVPGIDPTAPVFLGGFTFSVGMSIAVEDILTGKLQFYARGVQFDF